MPLTEQRHAKARPTELPRHSIHISTVPAYIFLWTFCEHFRTMVEFILMDSNTIPEQSELNSYFPFFQKLATFGERSPILNCARCAQLFFNSTTSCQPHTAFPLYGEMMDISSARIVWLALSNADKE